MDTSDADEDDEKSKRTAPGSGFEYEERDSDDDCEELSGDGCDRSDQPLVTVGSWLCRFSRSLRNYCKYF